MSYDFPPNFVDSVVARYGGIRAGSEFKCKCPAHDDHDPSLYIRNGDFAPVFRCMSAGCSYEAIMAAFRRDGLVNGIPDSKAWHTYLPPGVPPSWPPRSVLEKSGQVPSASNQKLYRCHYTYRSKDGEIVGYVVRYEREGRKDTIPFFRRDDSGRWWRSGYSLSGPRSLYGAEKLKEFTGLVWVHEGEKCVDAFNRFISGIEGGESNHLAVTWPGGARAVKKADFSPLAGKNVVVFPDFDAPGIRAGRDVVDILLGLGCRVAYVDVADIWKALSPDDCEGFDFVDWLERGGKDLSEIARESLDIWPKRITKAKAEKESENAEAPKVETAEPEDEEVTADLELNEIGIARRALKKFGNEIRFVEGLGPMIYNNNHWGRDTSDYISYLVQKTVEELHLEAKGLKPKKAETLLKFAERSKKRSVVSSAAWFLSKQPALCLKPSDLDSDPFLLNCRNGAVDLRSGKLLKHDSKNHFSKIARAAYEPSAVCQTWEDFLLFTFRGDLELIEYFQRAIGYCATGDCSEQVFFVTRGNGGNGKSVAFETILYVLGSYATPLSSSVLLLNSYGEPASDPFAIASLVGTRFCLSSEVPHRARLNEARMKELTGQDSIQARYLYQDFFTFKPIAKYWIRCNEYPTMGASDSGIWRRIRCIPFDRTLKEVQEVYDARLREKLEAEAPGILRWIVEGSMKWAKHGLGEPQKSMMREKVMVQGEMDTLAPWITERITFVEDGQRTHLTELFKNYRDWCKDLGEKERSANWLSRELMNRGYKAGRSMYGRYFEGLVLKHGGMKPSENI